MASPASPPPERPPLYDALTCVLSCSLQNDNEVQKLANQRKVKLQEIEDYPAVLCEIIGSSEEAVAERHLAAVFLKNYLEELYLHTRENPAFYEQEMGKRIALQLLEYLNIQYLNIRQMVSYNLAILLGMGFWDTLTLQLNDMIKSEEPDAIHNAVFVLAQTIDTKFFDSQEEFVVEQHWFDVLLDVFKMKNIKSETRLTTVHPMFMMMKYVKPHPNYVPECWTKLSEEFEKALNEPYSPTSDFQFKSEILKCLNDSTDEFSEYCNIFIPPSLPAIGNLLTISCEQYKKVIRGSEKPPKDASEEDDEEPGNFYELVSCILEFIYSLVDMNYFDVLIDDLNNLLYCIFVFMSCHDNMERYLFYDLLEKDHHWSIRDLCCQIITFALQKIEDRRPNGRAMFFKSMHEVFQRLASEADTSTHSDLYKVYYMTRITESMIFGLGIIRERYTDTDPEFAFPLNFYITLWTGMMSHCNMMLQGRILWLGGVYCTELSPSLLDVHLKTVLRNLNGDDKYLLIPSAEALCSFLKALKNGTAEKKFIISNAAEDILRCLISVARKSDSFPLNHSLNALGYFIKTYKEIAASNIDEIEDILIKTVVTHFADTFIMKEVNFIVAKLAQNNSFKILIHDKFLTFLQHVVHNLEPKEMRNDPDKALDILNTYSLYSTTIDDYFILQTFMGAATLLNANTDRETEIDESAINLLTTLIVKLPNQLQYIQHMPKGQPVIEEFPQLLEKLLEAEVVIPGPVFGKLVITTIFSLSELMEPHFETILQNVITSTCKDPKNLRATWIIFVFICMIRTSDTLSYLSVLPGPKGGSALNFIMKMWKMYYIQELETIERKVIVLSLTQIIQKCLESESEYAKMEELRIPLNEKPNEETPTGEVLNGMEYMYYLLVELLFHEDKLDKIKPPPTQPYNFDDFGEDMNTRKEEDTILLFNNHPLNINIVNHIVTFLKAASEPYFNMVRKFISSTNYFRLRDLGCNVPEVGIQEDME